MPRTGRSNDFLEDYRLLADRVRRLELRQMPDKFIAYSISGVLAVKDGILRWYPVAEGGVKRVHAAIGVPPAGSGVHIRVKKNGVDFDTLIIAAGTYIEDSKPSAPDYEVGDYFTVDVTSVGSSSPGSDLVVQLHLSS